MDMTAGCQAGFGKLLRDRRVTAGLTQEQVAERSGLSVRAISDIERGRAARPHRSCPGVFSWSCKHLSEPASHADPRTTMRYDRARASLDRHATYIVAAYIAGAAR